MTSKNLLKVYKNRFKVRVQRKKGKIRENRGLNGKTKRIKNRENLLDKGSER